MPQGEIANALFHAAVIGTLPQPESLVFHGDEGSLAMTGSHSADDAIQRFLHKHGAWEELPVPREVTAVLPPVQDYVQRSWNQFFREFVADVRGEGHSGYPMFREG
jgi:hypothetical protein